MLDWLQLALGELPVLACTDLGFCERGFVLSPPGATVEPPVLRKVLLSPTPAALGSPS